jgi:hypothetical protein
MTHTRSKEQGARSKLILWILADPEWPVVLVILAALAVAVALGWIK